MAGLNTICPGFRLPALAAGLLVAGLLVHPALWPLAAGGRAAAEPLAPVQHIDAYPGALDAPIEQKVSRGTEALLDWQHQINLKYDQDTRPRRARAGHPLIALTRDMLAGLPTPIHRLASRYTVALYLLEEDFGTGTTEAVQDEAGNWRYAYIALNLTALGRTANEWGTWKERSAFRSDPGYDVRMTLEPARENTIEGAVRFIFLHELGHVLGLALRAHGFWDAETLPAATRRSAFVGLSWAASDPDRMVSRWADRFALLSQLDFYNFEEARLSLDQAESAYRALAETDFPSLYGATNLFDDFAEAFAIYVHTHLLQKPYWVDVYKGDRRTFTYRSCIQNGRCPEKVRLLEQMLYQPIP